MNRALLLRFLKNVLPSMLAFTFSSLFVIVDGFFVGRNTGDVGLAAICIAFPAVALVQAAGTGLGMGGAIQVAVCRGAKEEDWELRFLGNTILLLLGAGVLLTILLEAFSYPILALLGAEGALMDAGLQYLRVAGLGSLFQVCALGFVPLLRNYDRAMLAMGAMVSGFLMNIVLDWLLVEVWGYGLYGAAAATAFSQMVTTIPCAVFLIRKARTMKRDHWKLRGGLVSQIIRVGLSPFGLSMSPNLVLLVMNRATLAYGGDVAVAAYAVISYAITVVLYLLQGTGDGSQPLMSLYLGQGQPEKARQVRNLAYFLAFGVAVFCLWLFWVGRDAVSVLFGASPEAGAIVSRVMVYFSLGAVGLSFARVTTAYFYSIRENRAAYVLVYGETVLLILFLAVLPPFLDLEGVWLATPAAQFLLAAVSAALLARHSRRERRSGRSQAGGA